MSLDITRVNGTISQRAKARVAFSEAACELSRFAGALVSTRGDEHAEPGEAITQARRARNLANVLVMRAVTLELAAGTPWDVIGKRSGLGVEVARSRYEADYQSWQDGQLPDAAPPPLDDVAQPDPVDYQARAARLDAWLHDFCNRLDDPTPVTGNLY